MARKSPSAYEDFLLSTPKISPSLHKPSSPLEQQWALKSLKDTP